MRNSCCGVPPSRSGRAAPLLCAGITTYSPLRHWKVGPGQKVGIVGLGGLGHMGVKLPHAMGAQVVLFTTSPGKREDACAWAPTKWWCRRTRGDGCAREQLRLHPEHGGGAARPGPFLVLLKRDGTMTLVGAPATPHPSPQVFNLIMKRRRLAGSLIGGIAETQEMLDFCAEHGIVSDIEMIRSSRSTRPMSACGRVAT
jgi:uncharacterized zinc-type alcohol dehydrogenase-like protein